MSEKPIIYCWLHKWIKSKQKRQHSKINSFLKWNPCDIVLRECVCVLVCVICSKCVHVMLFLNLANLITNQWQTDLVSSVQLIVICVANNIITPGCYCYLLAIQIRLTNHRNYNNNNKNQFIVKWSIHFLNGEN